MLIRRDLSGFCSIIAGDSDNFVDMHGILIPARKTSAHLLCKKVMHKYYSKRESRATTS